MTDPNVPSIARMRKRHTPRRPTEADAEDGRRLLQRQSFRGAAIASLVVIVVFGVLWAMLSTLTNRIFPWMTVVLGILIGLAIRRAGRGLDWRFPVLAAFAAVLGAFAGNVVVSAAFTARALDTNTLAVLGAVTSMTWPVYFEEFVTVADVVYALTAAVLAAYFANHRPTRAEFLALRKWQEQEEKKRA